MRQRIAVQQEDSRALSAVTQIDFALGVAGLDLGLGKAFEHAFS
jgi:hypothetical protein